MSLTDTTGSTRANSAGVDWAKDDYAVCVLDPDEQPLRRVTLTYTKAGLGRLIDLLERHRVHAVGIERHDGPIVDALLAADTTVYVIPPSQVKALRRRYGSAGNKDDRFDAYVLADTVRTDRRRLTPGLPPPNPPSDIAPMIADQALGDHGRDVAAQPRRTTSRP
jgi:hypothetical protein